VISHSTTFTIDLVRQRQDEVRRQVRGLRDRKRSR